jgi:hypothetical protein
VGQVEAGTPFARWFSVGEAPLPSHDDAAEMYEKASSMLRAAGYEHYEVSNYAKPGHRCAHNEVYWKVKVGSLNHCSHVLVAKYCAYALATLVMYCAYVLGEGLLTQALQSCTGGKVLRICTGDPCNVLRICAGDPCIVLRICTGDPCQVLRICTGDPCKTLLGTVHLYRPSIAPAAALLANLMCESCESAPSSLW